MAIRNERLMVLTTRRLGYFWFSHFPGLENCSIFDQRVGMFILFTIKNVVITGPNGENRP